MAENIHTVLVDAAIERVDALDAAAQRADKTDTEALVAEAVETRNSEGMVAAMKRAALLASMEGLAQQRGLAVRQVNQEARALIPADPATVPAVTSVDIAQRRAEKAGAPGEDAP